MRKYAALGFLGLGLMISPLLTQVAGGTVPAQPKIGAIDVARTFVESAAGKRVNAQFDKVRKDSQADLDKKKNDFLKAKADLEKQASVLKAEVLAQKKGELEKQLHDLEEYANKLDTELAKKEQESLDTLLSQAEPIIKKIAAKEGVSLIVDNKAIVWADPSMDLTAQLIAEMK